MARRKDPETEAPGVPVEATPVTEIAPEPGPDAEVPPVLAAAEDRQVQPTPRQSGILGPVLGGALAALGGFGLSHFNAFGLSAPVDQAALAALTDRLGKVEATQTGDASQFPALGDRIQGIDARLAALEAAPAAPLPDLSALTTLDQRLAAIEALPQGADASTAALAAKLGELERQIAALPAGGTDPAKVDAAIARLEAAEAEAMARAEAAAAVAATAQRAVALDALRAAVAAGAGFQAELDAMGDPALTATLAPHVAGVATVAMLRDEFPGPARLALDLARSAAGERGWTERLVDFLASQTGARSLTPREGDTPDAILSRADFALTEGRVADALSEVATLPPEVSSPFVAWISRAEALLAVQAALEAL